ncbi:ABC transporter permease [Actinospica durhamensis]|uniref:ABC transporter permease n=1 Tax=Actinospica durhamensis TaxID=1508375 RepID=A0A941IMC3_9ACTN|nr:ABC transporter permease [Actinospica durhamensis]MBR7832694.1 ABC transporter permease [Actinospica durhamensis]
MTSTLPTETMTGGSPATPAAPARRRRRHYPIKVQVGAGITLFFILIAIFGPELAPHSAAWVANTTNGTPQPPSGSNWLGTDNTQHDLYSALLLGARSTLLISFVAGAFATVLSVAMGVTSGYVGGVTDEVMSIITNIFLALPGLLILMVILKPLPPGDQNNSLVIGFVVALSSWAYGARALRAQTLTLRDQDYVVSARVIGERKRRIVIYEILPNLLPIVAASFIFTVIYGMGVYVALCYLGVVSPASGSWGTLLQTAQASGAIEANQWWWYLPPALCIALVGIGLALLNFGIDEIINPRIRSSRSKRRDVKFQLGLTPVVRPATSTVVEGEQL